MFDGFIDILENGASEIRAIARSENVQGNGFALASCDGDGVRFGGSQVVVALHAACPAPFKNRCLQRLTLLSSDQCPEGAVDLEHVWHEMTPCDLGERCAHRAK
jgi:hypothetical protein